jgi:hypothetical protein
VVLEKNGENEFGRSCEKLRSVTKSQGGKNVLNRVKQRNVNWISYILCRNYLLKQAIEGKIKGRIEMTGREVE